MSTNLLEAKYVGKRFFDSAYGVITGSSEPKIETISRTSGMVVRESLVYNRTIAVSGWKMLPSNYTRKDLESYMHRMAEVFGCNKGDLYVSGNTYPNAVLSGWSIDEWDYNRTLKGTLTFDITEQVQDNQFTVENIHRWSNAYPAHFQVKNYITGKIHNFEFRQHVFSTPMLLPKAASKSEDGHENERYSVRAGLNLSCKAWVFYGDPNQGIHLNASRKNLEAYFYNIICGPLGRIGTLNVTGNIYNNAFFQSFSQDDTGTQHFATYSLKFILSPQC